MKKRMRAFAVLAALLGTLMISSCASAPVKASWSSKGASLPRGVAILLGPEKDGVSSFRISGDELGGATLKGEARPSGDSWILEITGMDWLGNWSEGWSEGSFVAEGELRLRPEGPSWLLKVDAAPRIESPTSAAIRLYGDYFEGEKALALFTHRWDRIQAVDALLKDRFPEAWYDYAEPRRINNPLDVFARRVPNFQHGVRAFLFPELYGYPKGSSPGGRGARSRAESIDWDGEYTKKEFPENLRELRDSGTMLRDFEEGAGLWRLDFCWDALWADKIRDVAFIKK